MKVWPFNCLFVQFLWQQTQEGSMRAGIMASMLFYALLPPGQDYIFSNRVFCRSTSVHWNQRYCTRDPYSWHGMPCYLGRDKERSLRVGDRGIWLHLFAKRWSSSQENKWTSFGYWWSRYFLPSHVRSKLCFLNPWLPFVCWQGPSIPSIQGPGKPNE